MNRKANRPMQPAGRRPHLRAVAVLGAMILLYTIVFGYFQLARYYTFQFEDYDFALVCQQLWNISARGLCTETLHGWSARMHFIPGYILPAMVYRLGGAPAVLIAQTLLIALGAVPLYVLARHKRAGRVESLLLIAAYLLYAPLQRITLQDLHPESTVMIPLLMTAFYCLETRRLGWCWFWLGLTWLFKEEMFLTGFFFGVYLMLVKRRWRAGSWLCLASAVLFALVVFWVQPQFGDKCETMGFIYTLPGSHFAWWQESGLAGVLPRALRALAERGGDYVLQLGGPLLFLPLCAPEVLLLAVPALLKNLLGLPWLLRPFNYYQSFVIPFLMLGMVVALPRVHARLRLGRRGRLTVVGGILLAVVSQNWWYAPLPYSMFMRHRADGLRAGRNDRAPVLAAAVALVPENVSLMGTENVLAPLAARPELYVLHYTAVGEEYVVLDLQYQSEPTAMIRALHLLRGRVKAAEYEVLFFQDDVAVLRRAAGGGPASGMNACTAAFLGRAEAVLAALSCEYFQWAAPADFTRPRILLFARRQAYFGPVGPALNRVAIALGSYSDTPSAVFTRAEYLVEHGPRATPRQIFANNRVGYLADFPVELADLKEGDNRILLRAFASDGGVETAAFTLRCDSLAPRAAMVPEKPGNTITLAFHDEAGPLEVYYSPNDTEFRQRRYLTPPFPRGRLPYDESPHPADLSEIPYPLAIVELCNRPEFTYTWDLADGPVAQGAGVLYVRAEDLAGNVSAALALPLPP